MLKLDEKKIRKGKPYSLQYIGSKSRVSKRLIELFKQNFGAENKIIYDVFGGGGAVTLECLLNGLNVVYNDKNKNTVDALFRAIEKSDDKQWLRSLILSRVEFRELRNKDDLTSDDVIKLLVNSFGYNNIDYLLSEKYSDFLYKKCLDILDNYEDFRKYKQTDLFKEILSNSNYKLDRLELLNRLSRINDLKIFKESNILQKLKVYNQDYTFFSDVKDSLIYLDPPYEGSRHQYGEKFNFKDFLNWAYRMSEYNDVLISSYSINDDRFEEVYCFKGAYSIVSNTDKSRTERLFMIKK